MSFFIVFEKTIDMFVLFCRISGVLQRVVAVKQEKEEISGQR